MKNLADLKRKLTLGKTLKLEHLQSVWNPPARQINYVGSNKIGFATIDKHGKHVTSYMDIPKANDLQIIDDNTFIINSNWYKDGKEQYVPLLKYTFLD